VLTFYSVTLNFDTGSITIGVLSPDLTQCEIQPDEPCRYGTYNNLTSATAVLAPGSYYDGTGNMAFGNFISDAIVLGGQTFDNITFGQIESEDFGEATFYVYECIFGKHFIF